MSSAIASLKLLHPRADFCFVLSRALERDLRLSPDSTVQCRIELWRHHRRRTCFRARLWKFRAGAAPQDGKRADKAPELIESSHLLGEDFHQFVARSENEALGMVVARLNELIVEALPQ
jgi:hypothetical protein